MNEKTYSATEARIHFGELLRLVAEEDRHVIVERGGKPAAVVISPRRFEEMRRRTEPAGHDPIEGALALGRRIARRRKGKPLTPPEEIIREMREERDAR